MENDKHTIKADFGIPHNHMKEITFYSVFKNHQKLELAIKSLDKASLDLFEFMLSIENPPPEYYQELIEFRKKIMSTTRHLQEQFEGGIKY